MKIYDGENIRNVVLLGHADTGKTERVSALVGGGAPRFLGAGPADLRTLVPMLAARPGYLASDSLVRLVPAPAAPERRGR